MQNAGIIEPVKFFDWAVPIVLILNFDGSLCICGDYKVTVNQVVLPGSYPLPNVDNLLTTQTRGEAFSKLDLAHAYQQLELDEDSKIVTTVNTLRGLYR